MADVHSMPTLPNFAAGYTFGPSSEVECPPLRNATSGYATLDDLVKKCDREMVKAIMGDTPPCTSCGKACSLLHAESTDLFYCQKCNPSAPLDVAYGRHLDAMAEKVGLKQDLYRGALGETDVSLRERIRATEKLNLPVHCGFGGS